MCIWLEAPRAIAVFGAGLMEMLTDDSYEIPQKITKFALKQLN